MTARAAAVPRAGSLAEQCGHTPRQNRVNAALLVAVAVPWAVALFWHVRRCGEQQGEEAGRLAAEWCELAGRLHPVSLVNVYFFANVCVLFWLISLAQRSTWLIDPYWTILPVGINYVYQLHPDAAASRGTRAFVAEALLWLWAVRLTHSYFRREEWNFGAREDWRFTQYRERYPGHWWWMQVPVCYLSQQLFLVGITLPLYSVHFVDAPWSLADSAAAAGCAVGVVLAYFADTQLHEFMQENARRTAAGLLAVPVLNSGLWYYSRRPNYFGEQLFWWSLGLFAARLGHPWFLAGAAVNSACLLAVTRLVEERMRAKKGRRRQFDRYVATTSMWLPLPKFAAPAAGGGGRKRA